MKNQLTKITLLILMVAFVPFCTVAQNNAESTTTTITKTDNANRLKSIQAVPELQKQLVKKFGANYSLESTAVKEQLLNNAKNTILPEPIRKTSLYARYGKDYHNYLNLLNDLNK